MSGSDGHEQRKGCLRKVVIMLLGCVLAGGCAKVSHLDQLLMLKGLSDEQAAVNQYVQTQDRNFDLMLKAVRDGTLEQYSTARKMRQAFGEPVFARKVTQEDQEMESWLYRYATQYFGAEKVYLYFDLKGNLVKSEYVEENDGKIREETAPEDGREDI